MKNQFVPMEYEKANPELLYDAIIIGAGLSGLTVGNILTYQGYKVLIIDKNHIPGGYVVNFVRGEYRFDTAIHFINGCGEGGMVHSVLKLFGAENAIEWLPIENLFHWKDPKNNYSARPPVRLQEYTEFLCKEFPKEAKNIRKFMSRYSKLLPLLMGLLQPGLAKQGLTILKAFPTMMRFLGNINATVDDVIRRYFKDPALIELLTIFVSPFGMTRKTQAFFIWAMNEFSYRVEGAWYPKGGAGQFTSTLATIFQQNGGTLLLNHEVLSLEIDQKKKMVKSVRCKDRKGNETTFRSIAVVNAADLYRLATTLVPKGTFSEKWIKKISERNTIHSLFIVYLGLNLDLTKYGITEYELWQLNSDWNVPEIHENLQKKMDYSKIPMEIITFYSNGPDKSCCPPGKTVLSCLIGADLNAWKELLEENGKKGEKYYQFKRKSAETFVQRLSELLNIPDLKSYIEVMEVATPITLYRYSYAYKGTPIGYAFDLDSVRKTQLYGTAIKNLSLAGHFTFPGGGMSTVMLGGMMAARAAIKRIKKFKK